MKRKSIIFTKVGLAELIEEDVPYCLENQVKVKMQYTVVSSGTERAVLMDEPNTFMYGQYPKRQGYCGVGIVIEKGLSVKSLDVGDRVLVYHGGHSTINVVNEESAYKIYNEGVSSLDASMVIISAMGLGGVRKLEIELGESAMVIGLGLLGMFSVEFLRQSGANPVIAVDFNKDRRDLALKVGADYAFDPREVDFLDKVKVATRGKGVNGIVEVTGSAKALNTALDCASYQGRISLLGCTRISNSEIDYYTKIHKPGVKLIGAHNFIRPKYESYPHHWTNVDDCNAILGLIERKRIDVSSIISRVVSPLDADKIYNQLVNDKEFPIGTIFNWEEI